MKALDPDLYRDVDPAPPMVEIGDVTIIQGGDLSLHLIPTPGHTPDHLSVWCPEIRLLLTGDAAEMPIPYMDVESDVRQLRSSLRTMRRLDPKMVLYSHGGGITSPTLIDHNMWYLDEAERRCRETLKDRAGGSDSPPTPEEMNWPLDEVMPLGLHVDALNDEDFYRKAHERATKIIARSVQDEAGQKG